MRACMHASNPACSLEHLGLCACMQMMALSLEMSVLLGLALLIGLFALKFTKVRLPSYTDSPFGSHCPVVY